MPLVIITGFPASGKTRRCQDLEQFFEKTVPDRKVVIISENDLVPDRNATFSSSPAEKDVRGDLKGQLVRKISRTDIVIVDALNYIKGFRYELFCISKNCRSAQVTVQCSVGAEMAWQWNVSRDKEQQYSREVFDALLMRYEEPDSRCRWDSPLFTIQPDDATPAEAILDALLGGPAPKPNQSTQNPMLAPTDFLYELDKQTLQLVKAIQAAQETAVEGDELCLTPVTSECYVMRRRATLAELSRTRRQFVSYMKTHPAESERIPALFLQYLTQTLS